MSEKSSVKRIVRASHDTENPYFMMLRATAQHKALSYEARGLIAYLLSKPDDWEIMIEDLCQECGRGRVYRIIKDLLGAQYLQRIYHRDELGKIVYVEYVVHEQPFIENPEMANPKVDNPKVGNRTRHNKENTQKKDREEKKETFTVLIQAWLETQKSPNKKPYSNETVRTSAKGLFDLGITREDVTAYILDVRSDDWWKKTFVKFEKLENEIVQWKEQRAAPANGNGSAPRKYSVQQQVAIEQAAAHYGITVEEYLANVEAMQK